MDLIAERKFLYSGAALLGVRVFMALATLYLAFRPFQDDSKLYISSSAICNILRVGFPFGVMGVMEVGVFSLYAYLTSLMGTASLAAHQIATSLVTAIFVLPSTLGILATIWIGYSFGKSDIKGIIFRYKWLKRLVFGGAALIALFLVIFGDDIGRLWTDDPAVLDILSSIIVIAGFFQFFDWFQIFLAGCFRGTGKTTISALVNFFGHWMIGVPVALILTTHFDLGVSGLWWGVLVGLAVNSIFLSILFKRQIRHASLPARVAQPVSPRHTPSGVPTGVKIG